MVKLVMINRNRIYRQSLKYFLELDGIARVIAEADNIEDLLPLLQDNIPDIALIDNDNELFSAETFVKICQKFPGFKSIVFADPLNYNHYSDLIRAGVKGCVSKSADLAELQHAIQEVTNGKAFFPREVLQQVVEHSQSKTKHMDSQLTSRELEILELMCGGLSNAEVSEKLHLSYDTIKWHRSNILLKCDCNNILSLYKYALRHKLVKSP